MRQRILSLLVLFACSPELLAQFGGGNSVSVISPYGELSKTHKFGLSFNGNVEYGLRKGAAGHLVSEIGYSIWRSDESVLTSRNLTAFSTMVGYRTPLLKSVYIETRFGLFFGDIKEFVAIPAIGIRLGRLDLNLGYNMNGDPRFINGRIAYFWTKRKDK